MPFINDILNYRSLAIVGLEKNTGKTECLNYILRRLRDQEGQFALTSIGVDGESRDQLCQTAKPEIEIPEGMIFVTSGKHFREKHFPAEILEVGMEQTALGELVMAKAVLSGKTLLSGPSSTPGLQRLMLRLRYYGVRTTLVDGALSRLSLASPAVTEAMILATGAAVSGNIPQLVRKTRYVYDLLNVEKVEEAVGQRLEGIDRGVWAVDTAGQIHDLELPSLLLLGQRETDLFRYGYRLYVAGAVSDKLLSFLRAQKYPVELIVRDFTRLFATPETYYAFLRKGGQLRVLQKSKLLAITVNPQSPEGFCLNSGHVRAALEENLGIPVYDVRCLK